MIDQKKKLLEQTYQDWIHLILDANPPLDKLESIFAEDIMGFGTTLEERIFGREAAKELILLGIEQRKPLNDFRFEQKEVLRRIVGSGDVAIFVEELQLSYSVDRIGHTLPLRLTSVFIYKDNVWKGTHWHGSVGVETEEGDTWHADEWKRENEKLQRLVDERTAELKQSIANLKATQAQLIQSEKMASLGELTAGIAHEIQNPLNFVNNFSEVSNELIDEIQEEREKNKEERDEELVGDILEDIKQNLEKINHHGKRADSIVKGMLQHSRSSNGKKEPTNINTLADEYLRLAYHGLRAKDKSFNATMITDFDESIEIINVVPQDIGRVILNLITNAFYVVDEKKKSGLKNYEPTVTLTTKKNKDTVLISVKDNGNGIPQKVLDKIFQPFFTTKPTGQGTGLGLSMSYDIITKGHGGELKVDTKQGKGTTFTITLPTN